MPHLAFTTCDSSQVMAEITSISPTMLTSTVQTDQRTLRLTVTLPSSITAITSLKMTCLNGRLEALTTCTKSLADFTGLTMDGQEPY